MKHVGSSPELRVTNRKVVDSTEGFQQCEGISLYSAALFVMQENKVLLTPPMKPDPLNSTVSAKHSYQNLNQNGQTVFAKTLQLFQIVLPDAIETVLSAESAFSTSTPSHVISHVNGHVEDANTGCGQLALVPSWLLLSICLLLYLNAVQEVQASGTHLLDSVQGVMKIN
ncbi:hypothetical protein EXN66_Car002767 [Channa argus]|uniref:Uncharacterized protein n=1 Tax=Channa argus TaxID=215402 RepID=A0A6G1PA09_CHAAH|nr:hypothetical protein EXN66_Car002767 [Channa argus]